MTRRLRPRQNVRVDRFVDDDSGYVRWLGVNHDGFVLNTARTPSSSYLVLHGASCHTINGEPARGSRRELEAFAASLGGAARPCGTCI
jgi:hypothetical protein